MSSLPGDNRFLSVVKPAGVPQPAPLPVLATANDLREVVQYLKKRPDGVEISEVPQPLKKRVFYPPKVAAYEAWGVVSQRRGRLMLTQRGREFARALEPEARSYRLLLRETAPFHAALGWMWEQGSEVFTQDELADYWQEEFASAPDAADRRRCWESAVCLFHLCQAAELGVMNVGKRGQPARLRVMREELRAFLHGDAPAHRGATVAAAPEPFRVSISCRRGSPVVEQIKQTLDLFGIQHETTDEGRVTELRAEARCCHAGVVVITKEDGVEEEAGAAALPADVLSNIGRAFLSHGGRILLLWDEEVSVPAHLQAMRRCLFRGDGLTWEAGVELLKVLKEFAAA
ncbi:MAG: hypothetical protein JOZ02_14045, partial [Acidobacteria bacterium]|nr:hypothetical protein [Acidobacteriota bacterium]